MTRSEAWAILLTIVITVSFASMAYAASVAEVLEPVKLTAADGETINLGTIGPGQTLFITINGKAPGIGGREANWGVLGVLQVPAGWQGYDSPVYAKSMRATVKADDAARDGQYRVMFKLTECEKKEETCEAKQGLGSVTFFGNINVNKKVLSTLMPKRSIAIGVGQPARYDVVIENKGSANDVFEISSEGIPAWDFKKNVFVPAGGKALTFYEIVSNEEKEYEPTITVKSVSSEEMKDSYKVSFVSRSDVIGDIRATKNGVLLFPIVLQPLYALLGILGYAL